MTSPSGISYTSEEDLIEKIAASKAYQHKRVGYYDAEDIKQEVRIKCWGVLNRYNPDSGTNLYVFLSVCAENRIRDIKRSIMYKHNKPCLRCPFWNDLAAQSGQHDCVVFSNKMDCEKYKRHEKYVQAKLSASHPVDINSQIMVDKTSTEDFDHIDIIDYVLSSISSGILPLFVKFSQSNYDLKALKPRDRKIMISSLRDILSDF